MFACRRHATCLDATRESVLVCKSHGAMRCCHSQEGRAFRPPACQERLRRSGKALHDLRAVRYASSQQEVEVIEGELPPDLAGCYLRTGELAGQSRSGAVLLLFDCTWAPGID